MATHQVMLRDRWERFLRDDPKITKSAQHVLLAMATYGNRDGSNVRVSVPTLAEVTGWSAPTVERAKALGRRRGYLFREERGHHLGNGSAVASVYRLTLPLDLIGKMPRAASPRRYPQAQPITRDGMSKAAQPITRDGMSEVSTHQTDGLNPSLTMAQPITGDSPQVFTRVDKGAPPPPGAGASAPGRAPQEPELGPAFKPRPGESKADAIWRVVEEGRALNGHDQSKAEPPPSGGTHRQEQERTEESGPEKIDLDALNAVLATGYGPGAEAAMRAAKRIAS
jgi:hypothetical protein